MEKTLKLVGKTSNEIFTLRYPSTLLDFCEYDFSYFAKHSIDLCNESLKNGVLDIDRMAELRRDIQSSHCYIEHNIRTVYDKVVLDCWIDYVCRRDNISANALWNRFIHCRNDFEKAVFSRLCDFRYNRAINEWVNIVRVQDYARCKTDFIFVNGINSVEDAVARRNYFDLTFSVTARELGCRIEDMGVTKTFSVGRVPTAPFMFPNVSKDIVRNVLADFDYSEDYSDIDDYGEISDEIAMDAFSRMKAGMPQDFSNYGVTHSKMENYNEKIYMPCSLKAVIDLEIDAILESNAWLGRCKRCGRYFLRDKDHLDEYCSRFVPNGKTCLEIWEEEHPKPTISKELEDKSREVVDKMYSRVDETMSVKEYENWHSYLEAMKQKVINGEIPPEELNSFLDYSLQVDITKSTPIVEVPKKAEEPPKNTKDRVVKPFVPERISRDSIQPPPVINPDDERALKEGFFTSPKKQRKKNEKPQISHIIRNGEDLGGGSVSQSPNKAGFQPFGAQFNTTQEKQVSTENNISRSTYEDLKRLEQTLEDEKRIKRQKAEEIARRRELDEEEEQRKNAFKAFADPEKIQPEQVSARAMNKAPFMPKEEPPFKIYDDIPEEIKPPVKEKPKTIEQPKTVNKPENKPPEIQKPKVIRKNAAAISAYGKAAGAPVVTAAEADMAAKREKTAREQERVFERDSKTSDINEQMPDSEPFKNIGSIFDDLEQSGGNSRFGNVSSKSERQEPIPEKVTRENAPSGIWTEDRGLFGGEEDVQAENKPSEPSELDMLKSKKHKSNKTRRLYDAIMREPDDNPNFRKKK